jgi:hypothetical protein
MAAAPQKVLGQAHRKLTKFLRRSNPGLGKPIVDLRDKSGSIPMLELTWERVDGDTWRITGIEDRQLDKRIGDSTIVECRMFFTAEKDCYLPGVVSALQSVLTLEQGRARRPLRDRVAQVVTGSRIGAAGPIFHSGRLEVDNGLGPGALLGSDLMAMDYIYGIALHEDDDRLARPANVNIESALQAVVYHFNDLLHIITNVRAQIENDLEKGYLQLPGADRDR